MYCTWDIAWRVADLLGVDRYLAPLSADIELPGLADYDRTSLRTFLRTYQKTAIFFLLLRAYAILALPMRTGKTVTALAADRLLGPHRTLIVCPSIAKWVWAEEIARRFRESAVILEGLSGLEAKIFCVACMGRGVLDDGSRCSTCIQHNGSSYGYRILQVRPLTLRVQPLATQPLGRAGIGRSVGGRSQSRSQQFSPSPQLNMSGETARSAPDGRSARRGPCIRVNLAHTLGAEREIGPRLPTVREAAAARALAPPLYQCPEHPDVIADRPLYCTRCRTYFYGVLQSARYISVNYDILAAAEARTKEGRVVGARADMPGWVPTLEWLAPSVAILDEGHIAKSRPEKKRAWKTRHFALKRVLRGVSRVWALTGTPLDGRVRDLYGLLDVISGGLFGARPYNFDERYCEGHVGVHGGWVADGESELARTELKARLEYLLHRRDRREILPELPAIEHIVHRIDSAAPVARPVFTGDKLVDFGKAFSATLEIKIPTLLDLVTADVQEGLSVFVLAYLKDSVERIHTALERHFAQPALRETARAANLALWYTHGGTGPSKARFDLAANYRVHAASGSSAVLVSNFDCMKGVISLRGAHVVYVVEPHFSSIAFNQAIERPYEPGVLGLTAVHLIARGTSDEITLGVLLPKLRTVVTMTGDSSAEAAHTALTGQARTEYDTDEMYRRLTAHLDEA